MADTYPSEAWGIFPIATRGTNGIFLGVPSEPEKNALPARFGLQGRKGSDRGGAPFLVLGRTGLDGRKLARMLATWRSAYALHR